MSDVVDAGYAVTGVLMNITPRATCVLAPNPSVMTLDGTNTWVLAEPAGGPGVVVDPGPLDEGHLQAVLDAAAARGIVVQEVLLTHRHADHEEGADHLARLVDAPVRSVYRGTLTADDTVRVGALEVRVVATPGHTSDSVCFHLPAERTLLTGDTILGRGTTVVAWPDGRLGAYLDSLSLLADLVRTGSVGTMLPGHGAPLDDPAVVIAQYLTHRHERLRQVREAVAVVGDDVEAVVQRVYAHVSRDVWPAARLSVRAQLEHLREHPDG